MRFRSGVLVIIASILFSCLSAMNIDELRIAYYDFEDTQEYADQLTLDTIDFIAKTTKVDDLNAAVELWLGWDEAMCEAFLENKTQDPAEDLKYFYLWFHIQPEPLSRIDAGRQLIEIYPNQVYGYRLMVDTYLDLYPFDVTNPEVPAGSDATPMQYYTDILNEDIEYFNTFALNFDADDNSLLAGIFYHMRQGDFPGAKRYMDEAWRRRAAWLNNIQTDRLSDMMEFHEMIAYYLELLAKDKRGNEDAHYDIMDLSAMLLEYYFEDSLDYQAVVKLAQLDPAVWESYYNRYVVVSSYVRMNDVETPWEILTRPDNLADAVDFQDAWLSFDPIDAAEIYSKVLANRKDFNSTVLRSRVNTRGLDRVTQGRMLVRLDARSPFGYKMLGTAYREYFAEATADMPDYKEWLKNIRQDKALMRSFYLRWMDDPEAILSYLMTELLTGKQERVPTIYQALLGSTYTWENLDFVNRLLINQNNYDLLMITKQDLASHLEAEDALVGFDAASYAFTSFCETLYENRRFPKLIEYAKANPEWMEMSEIQYMVADAYFYEDRFTELIETLYFMVDRATIGYSVLKLLEGSPLSQHEAWPGLLEYASTMPDPHAAEAPQEDGASVRTDDAMDLAQDWTLTDPEGMEVTLSDLRGTVVILDFWATWCGPCTRTMPLLHQWMENDMPDNVLVFSINVWEEDKQKAIKYMNDNGFAMHLLFGDEDLTAAYGVEGIPYLCLIDAEGNLRFSHVGYTADLPDLLNDWMAQLQN